MWITLTKRGEIAVWVTFKVNQRYSLLEVNVEEEGTQNGHMKVIKIKKKNNEIIYLLLLNKIMLIFINKKNIFF